MNKKGFTLIEIIISISLIIVVGLGSLFAVNFISNRKLISRLEQITDKAINAAQVYIETNEEVNKQLYNNKNGVSLPLQLLVKEGLLSLDNTELTESDIENQYVITFLGSTNSNDNCEQITSTTSWGNDKEIYLCLNSDGSSNLSIIHPSDLSNLNKVRRERYYFKGTKDGIRNYVKYGEKIYQIYYVDTDDTLVLYSTNSFGNIFNGKTLPISSYDDSNMVLGCKENNSVLSGIISKTISNENQVMIDNYDVFETSYCIFDSIQGYYSLDGWMKYDLINTAKTIGSSPSGVVSRYVTSITNLKGYKIHLNNRFKITSGTGDYANPYILEYK